MPPDQLGYSITEVISNSGGMRKYTARDNGISSREQLAVIHGATSLLLVITLLINQHRRYDESRVTDTENICNNQVKIRCVASS